MGIIAWSLQSLPLGMSLRLELPCGAPVGCDVVPHNPLVHTTGLAPITDSVVGPFDQCLLSNLRAPDAKLPCPWASPDWPWAWQAPALGWPYCPQIYRKTLGDEKNWSNLWHFTQGINQDDPAKKFEFLMNHLSVPHVVNELAAEAVMLQQVRIRAVSDL
eukprot:6303201-Pyramimonas_sp.AAC.2